MAKVLTSRRRWGRTGADLIRHDIRAQPGKVVNVAAVNIVGAAVLLYQSGAAKPVRIRLAGVWSLGQFQRAILANIRTRIDGCSPLFVRSVSSIVSFPFLHLPYPKRVGSLVNQSQIVSGLRSNDRFGNRKNGAN